MTALMMIRNMKRQLRMISDGDYSLKGIKGRELRKMTVGIVGAGRIGFETIKIFRSFTPDLLVYDMIERNDVKEYASYVSLEELYERSDMIIYHCPLTEENYHMVNEKTIAGMKEGVILINPARGGLGDSKKSAGVPEKRQLRQRAYRQVRSFRKYRKGEWRIWKKIVQYLKNRSV